MHKAGDTQGRYHLRRRIVALEWAVHGVSRGRVQNARRYGISDPRTKANMDSDPGERLDGDAKVDKEGGCAVPFPGLPLPSLRSFQNPGSAAQIRTVRITHQLHPSMLTLVTRVDCTSQTLTQLVLR